MLTIDDYNSIMEKYSDTGFWYEIDFNNLEIAIGKKYKYDFCMIETRPPHNTQVTVNPLWGLQYYIKNSSGEIITDAVDSWNYSNNMITVIVPENNDLILCLFITRNRMPIINANQPFWMFKPLSSLVIYETNNEFDDKFYIIGVGQNSGEFPYQVNGEVVPLEEDEQGSFLRLPSAEDSWVGIMLRNPERAINYYKVTFPKFKTLPILSIPTIYKGNTQTIQLLDDTEEITEFQAYYKGELLTDNKITLPYDADDYIDITVDLLDNRYPNSTLKLKAPTQMYIANSQSDVETAIANGITTLQVGDTESEVSLNGITLTNVQLVNSHIQLNNCTLTDCQLIQSTYTDNGANNINNTNFNECEITTTNISTYNDCTVSECTVTDSELHITGTLTNNTFTNSLIVSDGEITLTNNTFTGIGSKTYFPSHLYLTGDYIVSGNTFNLTGTFTELQFNMCLIKATNDFNVSEFINKNSFNLNITYGEENPSTLYYNIVDDDKIRARRI